MGTKIIVFVDTEYHLLLTLNEIQRRPECQFDVMLCSRSNDDRLKHDYNFEGLKASFSRLDIRVNLLEPFPERLIKLIEVLTSGEYQEMIFFQEQDPFMLALIRSVRKNKSLSIRLFQDGLKPYNPMKSPSLAMMKQDLLVWKWCWSNGVRLYTPFRILKTYKYAFSPEIDEIGLTYPESYKNWSKKKVSRLQVERTPDFKLLVEKVFRWQTDYLQDTDNVIFFVSQFMRDNGDFERKLLGHLLQNFNPEKLYIKFHPSTLKFDQPFVDSIKLLQQKYPIVIINSGLPAELYTMQLSNSIIISSISTAMFLNNPSCRFYYTVELAKKFIPRFNRYDTSNPTKHVKSVNDFSEIQ
jgi:hypothetical protein